MKLKRIFAAMSAALVMAFAMPLGVAVNADEPGTGTGVDIGSGTVAPIGQAGESGGSSAGTAQIEYDDLVGKETDVITFKKYLVLDKDADVPKTTFDFTVSQGTEISKDGVMKVFKGPNSPSPTVGEAVFTGNEVKHDIGANDFLASFGTDKKYVEEEVNFSLENVKFNEPGVYRYVVRENAPTACGVSRSSTRDKLIIDVYVMDDGTDVPKDNLKFAPVSDTDSKPLAVVYSIAEGDAEPDITIDQTNKGTSAYPDSVKVGENKVDGIVNTLESHDLYFAKKVSGNQASRDKFFEFTVTVNGLTENYEMKAELANAVAAPSKTPSTKYDSMTQSTSLIADGDGKATGKFYLQHDQYIILKGLPRGTHYTVTEDAEDYKSTAAAATNVVKTIGEGTDTKIFDDATDSDVGTENIYTGFKNEKEGIVPTGIVLSIVPVLLIGAAVTAGIILLLVRRKKNAE